MTKISIIVPTLNSERYLAECIGSICFNQHNDWECIIIDGGSKDGTLSIIDEFRNSVEEKRFNHIRLVQGKDKNEPDAINKGVGMATGEVLAWLDSDDKYTPGALDMVSRYFDSYPNVQWAYGRCGIIDDGGKLCRSWMVRSKEVFQRRYTYNGLLLGDFIAQPAVFIRRKFWDEVGELNTNERLAFDYDLWLRMGKIARPGYIDGVLAYWRAHKGSETARALAKDMSDGLRIAIKYSPHRYDLRIFQYGIYLLAMSMYRLTGAIRG